ncbi:hypothetical protein [Microcoleus sp. EPA2]|uniref:hypothetical protein n=1 Tax=Microcoleus sp. EPA2 TaxID=2841654 RepID=UPI00312BA0FA
MTDLFTVFAELVALAVERFFLTALSNTSFLCGVPVSRDFAIISLVSGVRLTAAVAAFVMLSEKGSEKGKEKEKKKNGKENWKENGKENGKKNGKEPTLKSIGVKHGHFVSKSVHIAVLKKVRYAHALCPMPYAL